MLRNNINFKYAEFGLQFAKKKFPLGGLNRLDVINANRETIATQLQLLDKLRILNKEKAPDQNKIREYISQLNGAFCGEISVITCEAIKNQFPEACVEVVDLSNHQLLVIGRKKGNPRDVSTWGDEDKTKEGVFLDPWANEFYLISALAEMQKGPTIPFYDFKHKRVVKEHYLSGNPRILECTNAHNDQDQVSITQLVNQSQNEDPNTLYKKGVSAYKNKDYLTAIEFIKKALEIFKRSKNYSEIVTCYSTMTSCCRDAGDCVSARKYCTKAINLAKEHNLDVKSLNKKLESIEQVKPSRQP